MFSNIYDLPNLTGGAVEANTPTGADGGYLAATEALRSTARWLVTAFAAAAAALVAGVPLTGVGKLAADEWPRAFVAFGSLAVALASVGYIVRTIAGVLTGDWVTLSQLTDEHFAALLTADASEKQPSKDERRLLRIYSLIDTVSEELYRDVASDLGQLHQHLRQANAEVARLMTSPPIAGSRDAEELWVARVRRLRQAANNVVACANYHEARSRVVSMKKALVVGVIVLIVALVGFALAVHQSPAPLDVRLLRNV